MKQGTFDGFLRQCAEDSVNALPFEPHKLARTTDPDTSKAAARSTKELRLRHAAFIMAALRDVGYRGLTSEEISEEYSEMLDMVAVARRMKELERRGLVERTVERRKNRSGRLARVWRVTSAD